MITALKNFLKTNKYFWKYRHLIHRNVWSDYYNSYSAKRRDFYSEYVNNAELKSVFEFGCASGPNLKNIQSFAKRTIFCFGYDLNDEAVNFAQPRFDNQISFFTSDLNRSLLEQKLKCCIWCKTSPDRKETFPKHRNTFFFYYFKRTIKCIFIYFLVNRLIH